MGAVFGFFAGFYYWLEKISGLVYNELLSKVHFWLTFIGVNITFFPMHFLGLAGMPRRIPDYPDAYAPWNFIASLGSMITVVGISIFFYIIYDALSNKKLIKLPKDYTSVHFIDSKLELPKQYTEIFFNSSSRK
jgi:cytochrome c oxidase subunit 1